MFKELSLNLQFGLIYCYTIFLCSFWIVEFVKVFLIGENILFTSVWVHILRLMPALGFNFMNDGLIQFHRKSDYASACRSLDA